MERTRNDQLPSYHVAFQQRSGAWQQKKALQATEKAQYSVAFIIAMHRQRGIMRVAKQS